MLICVFVLSIAAKAAATRFDRGLQPANRVHSPNGGHFNLLILIAFLNALSFDQKCNGSMDVTFDRFSFHSWKTRRSLVGKSKIWMCKSHKLEFNSRNHCCRRRRGHRCRRQWIYECEHKKWIFNIHFFFLDLLLSTGSTARIDARNECVKYAPSVLWKPLLLPPPPPLTPTLFVFKTIIARIRSCGSVDRCRTL